ncbi:MAG: hypothetical protein E7029_04585 [Planctomycetaceae bacterium]|nr:hypothetical protein [Planctomycetaceae bacterium]
MAASAYFIQECPTCGKRMQIRSQYLGKSLTCPNCMDQFIASDEPIEGRGLFSIAGNLSIGGTEREFSEHEFQDLLAGCHGFNR